MRLYQFALLLSCLYAGFPVSADPPDEWLGRWEELGIRSYVPSEWIEFAPADRRQIDLGIEFVSVWGGELEEQHILPIAWIEHGFENAGAPVRTDLWPFATYCDPVGVYYETEYSHPSGLNPPCPLPPCLRVGIMGCTDGALHIFVRPQGTPVEARSFGAVKSLY